PDVRGVDRGPRPLPDRPVQLPVDRLSPRAKPFPCTGTRPWRGSLRSPQHQSFVTLGASTLSRGQFVYAGRTGEPLQDHVATAIECKPSLGAEFANEFGRQEPCASNGTHR